MSLFAGLLGGLRDTKAKTPADMIQQEIYKAETLRNNIDMDRQLQVYKQAETNKKINVLKQTFCAPDTLSQRERKSAFERLFKDNIQCRTMLSSLEKRIERIDSTIAKLNNKMRVHETADDLRRTVQLNDTLLDNEFTEEVRNMSRTYLAQEREIEQTNRSAETAFVQADQMLGITSSQSAVDDMMQEMIAENGLQELFSSAPNTTTSQQITPPQAAAVASSQRTLQDNTGLPVSSSADIMSRLKALEQSIQSK